MESMCSSHLLCSAFIISSFEDLLPTVYRLLNVPEWNIEAQHRCNAHTTRWKAQMCYSSTHRGHALCSQTSMLLHKIPVNTQSQTEQWFIRMRKDLVLLSFVCQSWEFPDLLIQFPFTWKQQDVNWSSCCKPGYRARIIPGLFVHHDFDIWSNTK